MSPDDRLKEFVEAYREELNAQLPPIAGPRAMLRQRLEEAQLKKAWWVGYGMPIAGAAVAACLVVGAFYERGLLRRDSDLIPRSRLTPGETRNVSVDDVCRVPGVGSVSTVPASVRQAVFREYGIGDGRANSYEVDYLITPELGGADSIRNLWPEPYSTLWNAHVKDELETRLHGLVCAGEVDLTTAQREIARDWIGAYKKYFHRERPE